MRMQLTISLVVLIFAGIASAACPSMDFTGDCRVNFDDFAVLASGWLTTYDASDLVDMADEWLDDGAFVTTWDTSLAYGTTTVTLAIAGDVDAVIDWGDGTVETVTTPGPHVHDYGIDGIYTVSVTGSVTAYNSDDNGGADSEQRKLVSVDNWGQLGLVSLYGAFSDCRNLVSVPDTSTGIEAVANMARMFKCADLFNQDIGGWDTSNVTNMSDMFSCASSFNGNISNWDTTSVTNIYRMFQSADLFNQDIGGWDTSSVSRMGYMFRDASSFNQDLSGWCVKEIDSNTTAPHGFLNQVVHRTLTV